MWLSKRKRNFVLMLCLLFIPMEVWSAEEVASNIVEVTFHEASEVQGDRVFLGHVATIFARNTEDFQALKKLEIAEFPQDQNTIKMPINYLRTRVAESLHRPVGQILLHGPGIIQFSKASKQPASSANIENPILAEIKRLATEGKHITDGVQLVIEPRVGFEKISNLSLDDYAVEPVMERQLWRGDMNFRLQAKKENGDTNSSWFSVSLRWYADTWTSEREIPFMTDIHPENFARTHAEVTNLDGVIMSASIEDLTKQLVAARAKRTIRARTVLTAAMLDRRPDGSIGQNLKVIFVADSGLRVTTDGELTENASFGSVVKARLKKSKKIVVGTLVSANTLEVRL